MRTTFFHDDPLVAEALNLLARVPTGAALLEVARRARYTLRLVEGDQHDCSAWADPIGREVVVVRSALRHATWCAVVLAHELRHVDQHLLLVGTRLSAPFDVLLWNRIIEADADAVEAQVGFELAREFGLIPGRPRPYVKAFGAALDADPEALRDGRAARAAFLAAADDRERLHVCDHNLVNGDRDWLESTIMNGNGTLTAHVENVLANPIGDIRGLYYLARLEPEDVIWRFSVCPPADVFEDYMARFLKHRAALGWPELAPSGVPLCFVRTQAP